MIRTILCTKNIGPEAQVSVRVYIDAGRVLSTLRVSGSLQHVIGFSVMTLPVIQLGGLSAEQAIEKAVVKAKEVVALQTLRSQNAYALGLITA